MRSNYFSFTSACQIILIIATLVVAALGLVACSDSSNLATNDNIDQPPSVSPVTTTGPQNDTAASQPQQLRGVAYTYTELELFWQNPPGSTAVRWDVSRDGQFAGSVRGPGFYDSGLKELTSYTYTVIPLDAAGQSGPGATITVTTPADAPVINSESAQVLAQLVTRQLSLDPLVKVLDSLNHTYYSLFPDPPYQGFVTCPGGGEAHATREPFEFGVTAGGVTLIFDNCLADNFRWDGSVSYSQLSFAQQTGGAGELASCTSTFTDLILSGSGALPTEVKGTLTTQGDLLHSNGFKGRLVQRMEKGSIILDANFEVANNGNYGTRGATGSFTIQSQLTGNRQLSVNLLGEMRIQELFQEGVIQVSDPHGGIMNIDVRRHAGSLQWQLNTDTAEGHRSATYRLEDGATMPTLTQWHAGTGCQLLYSPQGLILEQSGSPPTATGTDPFVPQQLQQTLDRIFIIQKALWLEEGFNDLDSLASYAESNGGLATAVPSAEASLLQEYTNTVVNINPETGEEEPHTFVVFGVTEKIVSCPLGGTVTDAFQSAGQQVYGRVSAVQCVIGDTSITGELNLEGAKYNTHATITDYVRTDASQQLVIGEATKSTGGVQGKESRSAKRMVLETGSLPTVVVEDFQGVYNEERDNEPDDLLAQPVSRVSAKISIDDGRQIYELSTDGDLHYFNRVDVREQGRLLATSVDGSTLGILFGNGDNESFDVEVNSTSGYSYTYRLPYTVDRYLRVR